MTKARLNLVLDPKDLEIIKAKAEAMGLSLSSVARVLIHAALKNGDCSLGDQEQARRGKKDGE